MQAWPVTLKERELGSVSVNVRITAVRKAGGPSGRQRTARTGVVLGQRIKGVRSQGVRVGNWLSLQRAQALQDAPDVRTNKSLRDRAMFAKTELGIPVILAYLGFISCEEMRKGRQRPMSSQEEWEELVRNHSGPLFPNEVWNQEWRVHGQSFIPVILTSDQPLSRV